MVRGGKWLVRGGGWLVRVGVSGRLMGIDCPGEFLEPRRHQHDPLWEASRGRPGGTLPKRKNASRCSAAAIFGTKPDTQSKNVMHRKKRDRRQLQQKMSSRSSFGLRRANLGSTKMCPTLASKSHFAKGGVSSKRNAHFWDIIGDRSRICPVVFFVGRGGSKFMFEKFMMLKQCILRMPKIAFRQNETFILREVRCYNMHYLGCFFGGPKPRTAWGFAVEFMQKSTSQEDRKKKCIV